MIAPEALFLADLGLLIAQGENIKYIQNQLGHASPTITLNVYAHLMKPTESGGGLKAGKCNFREKPVAKW